MDLIEKFNDEIDSYVNSGQFTATGRSDSAVKLSQPASQGLTKHLELATNGEQFTVSATLEDSTGHYPRNETGQKILPFYAKGGDIRELVERATNSLSAKEHFAVAEKPVAGILLRVFNFDSENKNVKLTTIVDGLTYNVEVSLHKGKTAGFSCGQPDFAQLMCALKRGDRARAFVGMLNKAVDTELREQANSAVKPKSKDTIHR